MTVTTLDRRPTPEARRGPPAGERGDGGSERRHGGGRRGEAYAEISLTAVTMAAVLGFVRLFSDWSFLLPALGAALVAHVLASGCRRLGLSGFWAIIVSLVGLGLFLGWVFEPSTTTMGFPGPSTWTAVHEDLSGSWRQFASVVAPTPTTTGFTMAAATGAWLAAWLADTFAFRARVRVEALVPSFTLFLFGAMLGADRHRVLASGAFLAAVIAFAMSAGAEATRPGYSWFAGRDNASGRRGLRAGAVIGAVAVVSAILVGPHLPGVDAEGLVSIRDKGKDANSSRVTVSPLVDIKGRLVEQSETEVFTVASPTATYWRLTSLDRFDGSIWSSKGNYRRAKGSLPEGPATARDGTSLRQDFTVSGLSSIWLPVAFRPERLVSRLGGLRYDAGTASLLTDRPTSDGLQYTIESSLPRFTARELASAGAPVPADIAGRYLDLPAAFPSSVRTTARRVVTPASTPYEVARTLQDWFRDNFTYSLDVPAGHDNRAIEDFLDRREGYCEQFAGTYAAMVRSLGLPSRVAVGFTSGSRGSDALFRVAGRNAHAWPEVYFAGFGWVAFEPTPGRGLPGAEDYTGVAAPPDDPPQTEAEVPAADADTGTETGTGAPAPVPTTVPGGTGEAPGQQGAAEAGQDPSAGENDSLLVRALFWFGLLTLAIAALFVVGVPYAKRARRARRRAAASTPASQVLAAWHDADEDLALVGLSRYRTETFVEHARRASAASLAPSAPSTPVAETRNALVELAATATAATWSPAGIPEDAAARAQAAAISVMGGVRAMTTRLQRFRWAIDPRPLFQPRQTRSLGVRPRPRGPDPLRTGRGWAQLAGRRAKRLRRT